MKAAVLRELQKPLQIEEVPDPTPGPAELVLKVHSCGICGSDLHISDLPFGMPAGTVMGHEFSGVVEEVGKEAAARCGRRSRVRAADDRLRPLRTYLSGDGTQCPRSRAPGSVRFRRLRGYVRVGMHETLRLPDAVDHRQGAMVEPLAVGAARGGEGGSRAGSARTRDRRRTDRARGLAVVALLRRARRGDEREGGGPARAGRTLRRHRCDRPGAGDVGPTFARLAGGTDVIFECVGVPGLIQECMTLARAVAAWWWWAFASGPTPSCRPSPC